MDLQQIINLLEIPALVTVTVVTISRILGEKETLPKMDADNIYRVK